jgi:hypothetical protein
MLHIGSRTVSRHQILGALTLICAVMAFLGTTSLAGLPLVPLALVFVAVALIW